MAPNTTTPAASWFGISRTDERAQSEHRHHHGECRRILCADFVEQGLHDSRQRQRSRAATRFEGDRVITGPFDSVRNLFDGDTVIVSSRWKGKGKYGKTEINDDQRCGQVFVRSGGKWKLLSEHCTQIVSR